MGSEWITTTLGEIVHAGGGTIQTGPFGSQLHASDYVSEGIPVIMPVNLAGNRISTDDIARINEADALRLARHIVKEGDIVYSRRGDVTRKALVTASEAGMFCGTGCLLVRPGKNIDPQFLAYHLSTPENHEWIIRHAVGATMPNLNTGILADVPLNIPKRAVQQSIAHILGALDNKIELNRQMNTTLEAMAQALFKSWFVDFDPVIDNALAAGNPIPDELAARAERRKQLHDRNGASSSEHLSPGQPLPAAIQQQFPDRFVFSEALGWVPEGWDSAPISELAILNPESWTPRNHPDVLSYVDLSNAKNGRINETVTYKFSEAPSRARRVLRKDDSIIGTVRPGNRSFAFVQDDGLTGSTGFAVMRPKKEEFRSYIYLALTRDKVIETFAHLADGGAYPAIRPDVVANQCVALPHHELLQAFDDLVYPWLTKIGKAEAMNEALARTRDTLLPKLLSGQLRTPEAEQQVAEII